MHWVSMIVSYNVIVLPINGFLYLILFVEDDRKRLYELVQRVRDVSIFFDVEFVVICSLPAVSHPVLHLKLL